MAFASHLDGSRHMLSPERSIEVQRLLGLRHRDAVRPAGADDVDPRRRSARRWSGRSAGPKRSRDEFDRGGEHADAVRQSSAFSRAASTRQLRRRSAEALIEIGFDGYAVGGLAVGEGQEAMLGCLDFAVDMLPADRPRYLMGVGKPDDIVEAVVRGIDMFDCVLPTRSGRTGQAFTAGRTAQPAQRAVRRGSGSDRARLSVPGLHARSSALMCITSSNRAKSSAQC